MSLVTPAMIRAQINTSLSDADLQNVIDREEREVIRVAGAHYTSSTQIITETLTGGRRGINLPRAITSVTALSEATVLGDTPEALTANTDYYVWPELGRIERLPCGRPWGPVVLISYKPADDTDLREAVIIELVRLALEHTALRSETVQGEYSYTAVDWEQARADQLARLRLNF